MRQSDENIHGEGDEQCQQHGGLPALLHVERRLNSNPNVTVDPGIVCPLGNGGRITSPFGAQDSALHSSPHQGVDYVYQAGKPEC